MQRAGHWHGSTGEVCRHRKAGAPVGGHQRRGRSLFAEAIAEDADCLLTGEANHHHALDAKRLGLSLIAAGHYATEFPVTAAVAAALRTALPELEVLVSTENRDPYTYL